MRATGIFNWPRDERVSDRYGMIGLYTSNYDNTAHVTVDLDRTALDGLAGGRVAIFVRVLEARQSGHLGDFFRDIFPSEPVVGELIDLGKGTLVVDEVDGQLVFGLQPDDGRENDWFDPRKLYRLHDQTVAVEILQVAPDPGVKL